MRARATWVMALLLAAPAAGGAQDPAGLAGLRAEIGRLSAIAQGKVGVGILHLETGRELYLNGDEPFPMASTFKVPVAVTLFDLVERKRLRLDSMVTLQASDLHPGSGTISNLLDDPGVSLSLLNLTEMMLLISDNSATDLVLKAVGGGAAVNARLAAIGVRGISVDRPTIDLIADAIGVKSLPPEAQRTRDGFLALARGVSPADQAAAKTAFYQDRRDTATPAGMTRLLAGIWRSEGLSPASSAQLLDIMYRCETGLLRIKGLLPPGIRVAHKTGTLGIGVTNDVGIIDLPGGAGHVALSVFVKESNATAEAQERTIAQIGRAVYDYFLFHSQPDRGSMQYRSPAGVEYVALPDTGAIARAERALAADPANIDRIIALGVAQSGARQFREAIATFSRGLDLAPDHPMLLRWRGHRYLSVRELDRAEADLSRGLRLDSTNYGILYHLGIVRFARGNFAGAAELFRRAQPRAPEAGELAGSTDWLWMSLSRAGRHAEAKAMLDRRPDSLPVNNAYAARLRLYRGLSTPDAVFTAADTSDVQVATLSFGIGNWYLVRGDTARARSWFERSVASGGWPGFGFILSEMELRRLR